MELINNIQSDILEYLGRFGYLAVSQFQVLTGKSVGYIREMLGSLKRRGYIKSYRIELSYQIRAENIYFLTPQGVEFLQVHKVFLDGIKYPIAKQPVVTKDYWHRFAFITVHLHCYMYLHTHDKPLTAFYAYFDKVGSAKHATLTAKTRIPLDKGVTYIPDGVMITSTNLYLLEIYMDKDSKRVISQLALHAKAITLATPAKTFGVETDPRVLSVFAHAGIMQAVIAKLKANQGFAPISHLYFFATLDNVKKDIGEAFKNIHDATLLIT